MMALLPSQKTEQFTAVFGSRCSYFSTNSPQFSTNGGETLATKHIIILEVPNFRLFLIIDL